MPMRKFNPVTPGRRQMTVLTFDEITTDTPHKTPSIEQLHVVEVHHGRHSGSVFRSNRHLRTEAAHRGRYGPDDHRVQMVTQGIACKHHDRAPFVQLCEPQLAAPRCGQGRHSLPP